MSASCHADHRKATFLAAFREHVSGLPADEPIHCCYGFCLAVAALGGAERPAEKELNSREKRRAWLQREDRRVVIHFTPFHGSWLNQAEICFHLIGQACMSDSYSCPDQIHAAILAFVEKWNTDRAHPFDWTYDGVGLHKKAVERFTAALKHSAPASVAGGVFSARLFTVLKGPVGPSFRAQTGAATAHRPDGVEDGIRPIALGEADELQQFAQPAPGIATVAGKPREILVGKVVDGHALGRVVLGTVLAEGHVGAGNLAEGPGKSVAGRISHR